jgi:hypothetical protein
VRRGRKPRPGTESSAAPVLLATIPSFTGHTTEGGSEWLVAIRSREHCSTRVRAKALCRCWVGGDADGGTCDALLAYRIGRGISKVS